MFMTNERVLHNFCYLLPFYLLTFIITMHFFAYEQKKWNSKFLTWRSRRPPPAVGTVKTSYEWLESLVISAVLLLIVSRYHTTQAFEKLMFCEELSSHPDRRLYTSKLVVEVGFPNVTPDLSQATTQSRLR